jgi:hypothetical protein
MLEIIALIFLSRKIGTTAFDKGYSKGLFVFLTIIFWIAGEFIGGLIGFVVVGDGLGPYVFALLGAGLGYGLIYFIVNTIEDKNPIDKGDADWKEKNASPNPIEIKTPGEK